MPSARVPTLALHRPIAVAYLSIIEPLSSAHQTPSARRAPTDARENPHRFPVELLQGVFCLLLESKPRRIAPDDPLFSSGLHLLETAKGSRTYMA